MPRDQARVSAFDYGFLYGYGLFETMRAYGGRVFRLDRHLERLARSAATLGIEVEAAGLKDAVEETLRANGLMEARVRLADQVAASRPPWSSPCRTCRSRMMSDVGVFGRSSRPSGGTAGRHCPA